MDVLSNFSQCVVSVAAFAFSSIKDVLQQLGEGCDGWMFPAVRVFLERERCISSQTSARQMLHPEDRRSSTGDAFLCAAAA